MRNCGHQAVDDCNVAQAAIKPRAPASLRTILDSCALAYILGARSVLSFAIGLSFQDVVWVSEV